MLVLSRKQNEQILVGDDIEITIVEMGRHRVKVGISAPPHVRVLRRELDKRGPSPADRMTTGPRRPR
jgi:carbon storage regulator